MCVEYGGIYDQFMASDAMEAANKTPLVHIYLGGEWKLVREDQLWFWSEEWQAGERQVDEYIAEGNIQEFDTIEEFLSSLRE